MPRKEHGENYSSQLAALVVSSPNLSSCSNVYYTHSVRQYAQMVLPWSNIHNLVKIVARLVVRSGAGAHPPFLGQDSLGSRP